MADKGVTIEDIVPLLQVFLKYSSLPELGMSNQMSTGDMIATQEIGSLRIHEERAMNNYGEEFCDI